MNNQVPENILTSARTYIAIVGGVLTVIAGAAQAFVPGLDQVSVEVWDGVTWGISIITASLVIARTLRNTKTK